MPIFLGERYLPHSERAAAIERAERVRSAVLQLAPEGTPVKFLSTTFVANEEWAFDLFEADSIEQVTRVYETAGIPVERVTEGVHLTRP
jgi:Protein of unknown function (DUF4242)